MAARNGAHTACRLPLLLLWACMYTISSRSEAQGRSCSGRKVYLLPINSGSLSDCFPVGTNASSLDLHKAAALPGTDSPNFLVRDYEQASAYFRSLPEHKKIHDALLDSARTVKWPVLPDSWHGVGHERSLPDMILGRLLASPCLVPDLGQADLVFVPFCLGLDHQKRCGGRWDLYKFLLAHQQFPQIMEKGIFTVCVKASWQYQLSLLDHSKLFSNPKVEFVVVERASWHKNGLSSPWPVEFHPADKKALESWVAFVREQASRRVLPILYYGAPIGGNNAGHLRRIVQWQCESSKNCHYIPHMASRMKILLGRFMALDLSSVFCLMPRGDLCSRKALINSILAGCIPVVFEECALEQQWQAHLPPNPPFFVRINALHLKVPDDYGEYESCSRDGGGKKLPWPAMALGGGQFCMEGSVEDYKPKLWIEDVLLSIKEEQVRAMQERLLELIPHVIYAGHRMEEGLRASPDFEDAFDFMLKGVAASQGKNKSKVDTK